MSLKLTHYRGAFVEQESAKLFGKAVVGSTTWANLEWSSGTSASELDGLVTVDDLTLRVQCKAGRMTQPARRGAPERMLAELDDLVAEAAGQHRALAEALSDNGAASLGFTKEQADALDAPLQMEVIVTLEDLTVWATHAHALREIAVLPNDRHVPWVLSLTDLMVIADILEGAQFIHYLVRRQRLERDGRIQAHDELDWLGHYLSEGLFFDQYFEGDDPPSAFRLLSYTEPIDSWYFGRAGLRTVDTPKPSQEVSAELDRLIRRLERERPEHWVVAGLALLDGDEESRTMWKKAIQNIGTRLGRERWSNATQVFDARLGVTLYVDHRTAAPNVQRDATDYARTKVSELAIGDWIVIGEGADEGLFVVVLPQHDLESLIAGFLTPANARSSTQTGVHSS